MCQMKALKLLHISKGCLKESEIGHNKQHETISPPQITKYFGEHQILSDISFALPEVL